MIKENIKSKERLLNIIVERSFKYSEIPIFKLASGKMSNYYIDCKKTALLSEGMKLIGELFYDLIADDNITAIGGLELGSVPISIAVSLISCQKGRPINTFIVRKDKKGHGTGQKIEGDFKKGDRVIVVEDVITTGGSAAQAIKAIENKALDIVKVLALVDREEGGREHLERLGYPVVSLFTKAELIERLENREV